MKNQDIAYAIKELLVNMAVEDKLPMDMTMLDESLFIPILEANTPNLTQHSQRNLIAIENFILHYTHGEEPLSSEMTKCALEYIEEDHVDGEGAEESITERIDAVARRKQKMVENARQFLVADSDEDIQRMINLIENYSDETQTIDFIEGVDVWEKVQYSFNCKDFMFQITPSEYI
jgi:hypothetical protein